MLRDLRRPKLATVFNRNSQDSTRAGRIPLISGDRQRRMKTSSVVEVTPLLKSTCRPPLAQASQLPSARTLRVLSTETSRSRSSPRVSSRMTSERWSCGHRAARIPRCSWKASSPMPTESPLSVASTRWRVLEATSSKKTMHRAQECRVSLRKSRSTLRMPSLRNPSCSRS